ncbi:hypothetical protein QR680_007739 [Steinernema hermaphroditum]|uniref:RNA-binding S4 domain-containing protein n=1 Tax=Steinernema hermaphroditum TaxID=289476 RepID=A0AA39IGI9_9BILA|nr:hypothetical protein QR680_007739 [Steinernema hermaphroditum]
MRRVLTLAARSSRLLLEAGALRPSAAVVASSRCFVAPSASVLARKQPPKKTISSFSNEDEEDDDEPLDDGLPRDYKLKTLKVGSRRLDTLVNRATGKSSSQVEKLILTGKVRVNEEPVTKKSYNVQKHDEIDVWKEPYVENDALADVHRVEIVDYKLTEAGYDIRVKSWQKMLVENWRGGSS